MTAQARCRVVQQLKHWFKSVIAKWTQDNAIVYYGTELSLVVYKRNSARSSVALQSSHNGSVASTNNYPLPTQCTITRIFHCIRSVKITFCFYLNLCTYQSQYKYSLAASEVHKEVNDNLIGPDGTKSTAKSPDIYVVRI